MLVEFSLVPIGTGVSISPYLANAIKVVDKSGLDYRVGPMGTVVEGDWDEIFGLIKKCHRLMMKDADRVITTISVDDRKDKPSRGRITAKVRSLEEKSGIRFKK